MRITEIKYERVKNNGNYESERLAMSAMVAEGEHVDLCTLALMDRVAKHLGLKTSSPVTVEAATSPKKDTPTERPTTTPEEVKEDIAERKEETTPAPIEPAKEGEVVTDTPTPEETTTVTEPPAKGEEVINAEARANAKAEKAKADKEAKAAEKAKVKAEKDAIKAEEKAKKDAAKATKALAAKSVKYDREQQSHRKTYIATLDLLFPDWRTNKARGKAVSVSLEGELFLDDNAEVLESFKTSLTNFYNTFEG